MVQHAILALFVSYVLSRIISATTYICTYTYYSSYFASHPCISRNATRVSTLDGEKFFLIDARWRCKHKTFILSSGERGSIFSPL